MRINEMRVENLVYRVNRKPKGSPVNGDIRRAPEQYFPQKGGGRQDTLIEPSHTEQAPYEGHIDILA